MGLFSRRERAILEKLAEVTIPAGRMIPAGNAATVDRMERYVEGLPEVAQKGSRAAVWAIEYGAIPFGGGMFSKLPLDRRAAVLRQWTHGSVPAVRQALRGLLAALKSAHFDDPAIYEMLGCTYGLPPATAETPRWLSRATDGREMSEDTTLEADVVIVGTGAGGAPLAYELALRGHAVVMIEEGRYFRRDEFRGRPAEMIRKLYRDGGMTVGFGNISVPVWAGKTVGGTTTVNSGTCYRAPERIFRGWRDEFGLRMFSSESMDAHYQRVEHIIGVGEAKPEHLDGAARVVARGAEKLGYLHKPLRRNAPDCDGQGLCCFGCPTGAKRSTDVSYVPMALERGAALFSSARVEKILGDRGEARGVVAKCKGGGTLTVNARMTVIAGGTLMTPMLLQSNKLALSSGMVGKNLSIHPAGAVFAIFDEKIEMQKGIPQGYCIEQFAEQGMLMEGGSLPPDVVAVGLPLNGPLYIDVMEQYANLAVFGYMIHDSSRGRVRRGPNGSPLITYNMNREDAAHMKQCVEALCRVFMAAGARRVFPGVHGFEEIRTEADLARFIRHDVHAGDFDVTAYHPLGTARMGRDPKTSVVGSDHQTHDVRNLYVVDGSAVPSSLGVNPQLTIMAMSTRVAEIMDRRLSSPEVSDRRPSDIPAAAGGAYA